MRDARERGRPLAWLPRVLCVLVGALALLGPAAAQGEVLVLRQSGGDVEIDVGSTDVSLVVHVCFETGSQPPLLASAALFVAPLWPFSNESAPACDRSWHWPLGSPYVTVRRRAAGVWLEQAWSARPPRAGRPASAWRVYDGALGLPRVDPVPFLARLERGGAVVANLSTDSFRFAGATRWAEGVLDVAVGGDSSCGALKTGGLRCWGRNVHGQLGLGHNRDIGDDDVNNFFEEPALFGVVDAVGTNVVAVTVAAAHTCALLRPGNVRCWGFNGNGELGLGHTASIGDDELPVTNVDLGELAVAVDGRFRHTCTLLQSGAVRCWGRNAFGALGLGHTSNIGDDELPSSVSAVSLPTTALAATAGSDFTCAILNPAQRAVLCWGRNHAAQLGTGPLSMAVGDVGDNELPSTLPPIALPGGQGAVLVECGASHACALLMNGSVVCWGDNSVGQLGLGLPVGAYSLATTPLATPILTFARRVVHLSSRSDSACATQEDGKVVCWGRNDIGRQHGRAHARPVGFLSSPVREDPIPFSMRTPFLASGPLHACVALESGAVQCWGDRDFGRLGLGHTFFNADDFGFLAFADRIGSTPPTEESGMELRGTGSVVPADQSMEKLVVEKIAAGGDVTCILTAQGDVRCCGANTFGVMGLAAGYPEFPGCTFSHPLLFDPIKLGSPATATTAKLLAVGEMHACVVLNTTAGNLVQCWGANTAGQLGLGHTNAVGMLDHPADHSPLALPFAVEDIGVGHSHTCALMLGVMMCWGDNTWGQLGLGHRSSVGATSRPTAVDASVRFPVGETAGAMALGWFHTCAIMASPIMMKGVLRCWGLNTDGQLGLGSTTSSFDDPQLPATIVAFPEAVSAIKASAKSTCAIRFPSGALTCWGFNANGELGLGHRSTVGNASTAATFASVGLGGSRALLVGMGAAHTCVVVQDATYSLRCWGANAVGQLGLANTVTVGDDEVPMAVGAVQLGAPAMALALGGAHSCAIVPDMSLQGHLRCWGRGANGQLFIGDNKNVGDDEFPFTARERFPWLRITLHTQANVMKPDVLGSIMDIKSIACADSNLTMLPDITGLPVFIGVESVLVFPSRLIDPVTCNGEMRYWGPTRVCTYERDKGWFEREPGASVDRVQVVGVNGLLDTKGRTRIVLTGFLEWVAAAGAPTVLVGGQECSDRKFLNLTALECAAPAGVGSNLAVVVRPPTTARSLPSEVVAPTRLAYRAPVVLFVVPSLDLLPEGLSILNVQGEFFGGAAFNPRVFIDGVECVQNIASPATDTLIVCRAPPSYAAEAHVVVEVGGQTSDPVLVRYRQPLIVEVRPSVVLPSAPSVLNTTFRVRGQGFGGARSGSMFVAATVGGVACPSVAVVSDSELWCEALPHPTRWLATNASVEFWTGSEERGSPNATTLATGSTENVLRPLDPPIVTRFFAQTMPTAGHAAASLAGVGLGMSEADVVNVTVGASVAVQVEWVSEASLRVTTPRGVGGAVPLVVHLRSGLSSTPVLVAYDPPVVSHVEPSVALAGTVGLTVTLTGSNFGWAETQFDRVRVGGADCGSVFVHNQSWIECRAWNAPAEWSQSEFDAVEVVVAGQSSGRVRGLFQVTRPPTLTALSSASFPTSGESRVRLVGDGFGFSSSDVARVLVGAVAAASVELVSFQELSFVLPPGVGARVPVVVELRTGVSSSTPLFLSYDRPEVTGVEPEYALAGTTNATLVLTGANLGWLDVHVDRVSIGGAECAFVRSVSHSACECFGWTAPPSWASGPSEDVEVSVAGQSSGRVRGLFQVIRPPVVSAVTATAFPTEGGTGLRVVGEGFGRTSADVLVVRVGPHPVDPADIEFVSALELRTVLPAGVGSELPVTVQLRTGLTTPATVLVSYDRPVLHAAVPSCLLAGRFATNVTLLGANFGLRVEDFDSIRVGGLPCVRVWPASASSVVCEFVADPVLEWPVPNTVEVVVAGQSSGLVVGVLSTFGLPRVVSVSPPELVPNGDLALIGDGFGQSAQNVSRILIAGAPCGDVSWTSAQVLRCRVPEDHWVFRASRPNGTTVEAAGFGVIVETPAWSARDEHALASNVTIPVPGTPPTPAELGAVGARLVIPAAWVPRLAPTLQVNSVYARREVGRPETMSVAFLVEDVRALNLGSPTQAVTNFVVEAASLDSPRFNASAVATGTSGADRTLSTTVVVSSTLAATSGVHVFDAVLLGLDARPFVVRVAAQASGLQGPWSSWTAPIPASCTANEYLNTFAPLVDQVCLPCPDQALCGGLSAPNVTSRAGFWRVPWSRSGAGFARCLLEIACEGTTSKLEDYVVEGGAGGRGGVDEDDDEFGVGAEAALGAEWTRSTAAVPGLVLDPTTEEQCRVGHTGVLCASCRNGYFKDISGQCQACGSDGVVVARIGGFLLAVMLILGILLVRRFQRSQRLAEEAKARAKNRADEQRLLAPSGSASATASATTVSSTSSASSASSTSSASSASGTEVGLSAGSIGIRIWKIVFNHIQTVGIIAGIRFRWPESVQEAYDSANVVASIGSEGVSLECALGDRSSSALNRTLLALSILLWLMAIAAFFWAMTSCVNWSTIARRLCPCCRALCRRRRSSVSEPGTFAPIVPSWCGCDVGVWMNRMKMTVPVLVFLVHTAITKTAFRLITCRDVAPETEPDNAQNRLAMELDVRCDDPQTILWMLTIALPVLVFFSLGVPLATIVLLHYGLRDLDDPENRRVWGFLYTGYRRGLQSWEAVNFIRKVLMAGVTVVLAPSGSMFQVSAALGVIVVALTVLATLRPYVDQALNNLELHSLLAAAFTMIFGMVIETRRYALLSDTAGPALIFLVNIVFFADALRVRLVLIPCVERALRCRKRAAPVPASQDAKARRMTTNPAFAHTLRAEGTSSNPAAAHGVASPLGAGDSSGTSSGASSSRSRSSIRPKDVAATNGGSGGPVLAIGPTERLTFAGRLTREPSGAAAV